MPLNTPIRGPHMPEATWLDPRDTSEAKRRPISDAVNIPLTQLPDRTHELPPAETVIRVAGPRALVEETVAWLRQHGRAAVGGDDFRYAETSEQRPRGRLWKPSALLATALPDLPPGCALDLACGTGRDAAYLAAWGWQVTAVDVLPDALERGRQLEVAYGPTAHAVDWRCADLERDAPTFKRFDLVTVFRYLHRPLLAQLHECVKPGGSILCETFTTLHRARHGRPRSADHVLEPRELHSIFSRHEIRTYSEDWRGTAHTARVWAVVR